MRIDANGPDRFVRGADGTLYRLTGQRRFVAVEDAEIGSIGMDAEPVDVPLWSDLDNSSARTFISPNGH